MALKVLIANPNISFYKPLESALKERYFEVDYAQHGKDTQSKIANNKYFAVILSYHLKNHSGPEVLNYIAKAHKNIKVILTIENENLFDNGITTPEGLISSGASDIMLEGLPPIDFLNALEEHQSFNDMLSTIPKRMAAGTEEIIDFFDNRFTQLPISDFFSTTQVLFPIYIKLGTNKYVKVLHAGDVFDRSRLEKYREKGVEMLHIEKKDRRKYIMLSNFLAKAAVNSKKANINIKARILKGVVEKFSEEAFQEGLKSALIEQGKEICENVTLMIESDPHLFTLFRNLQQIDPECVSHAYLTTLFTTSTIKHFDWSSKMLLQNAALASMLHDIGKTKIDPALVTMAKKDMSPAQLEEYKKHSELGAELIGPSNLINSSIKQIVAQHHEYFDGTGFPQGLKGNQIVTIGNILCLANDFAHILQEENKQPLVALKDILQNKEILKRFDSRVIEAFIKNFADPAKIKKDHHMPTNSRLVKSKKAS
jgi:response regulator RpfG family c-di-GMP phosphodiesterase